MKTKLTVIGVILAVAVINIKAQTVNPDVKASLLSFRQEVTDARNLTLAISPSYAPDLVNSSGKKDAWGGGVSLTYRLGTNNVTQHTFVGVQLDYIGSSFLSVGVAGGLKGDFQISGQNFTAFGYGGTVKSVSGSDTTEWGLMVGTGFKTTVKVWPNLFGVGPGKLDVGGAVEKWDKFQGNVYRVGMALSVAW